MLVKICGIRSISAAQAAARHGAAMIGFVFAPSRRFIEPAIAAEIAEAVPNVKTVGVFVDAPLEFVRQTAKICGLSYVQLHGKESPAYAAAVKYPVIKAFRFGEDFSVAAANLYPADMILIDSWQPGAAGGTGSCFDWKAAQQEVQKLKKPCLIAGGLHAGNASTAVQMFWPQGLDVSGGVEENGEKSEEKIQSFMQAVQQAEQEMKK